MILVNNHKYKWILWDLVLPFWAGNETKPVVKCLDWKSQWQYLMHLVQQIRPSFAGDEITCKIMKKWQTYFECYVMVQFLASLLANMKMWCSGGLKDETGELWLWACCHGERSSLQSPCKGGPGRVYVKGFSIPGAAKVGNRGTSL